VARRARGLIVVAEEHRDEFRAVAQYLDDLAEHDRERGISVWLVEAKAVKVDDSAWAPLFTAVVEPNNFTRSVEQQRQSEGPLGSLDEFWDLFVDPDLKAAAMYVHDRWLAEGHRMRLGLTQLVLLARGPGASGVHVVVALYADGRVHVPFGSYAGQNSGIPIPALTTEAFRARADALFGFRGTEKHAKTAPRWLTPATADTLLDFCREVAAAYGETVAASSSPGPLGR